MVWRPAYERVSGWSDPTHGRIDRDIQETVDEIGPTSLGSRVAMENTLQHRRDQGSAAETADDVRRRELRQAIRGALATADLTIDQSDQCLPPAVIASVDVIADRLAPLLDRAARELAEGRVAALPAWLRWLVRRVEARRG